MVRPYSDDLRERVLKEAERSSARRAAVRFGISAATAVRWAARARMGERSARPWGGRRGSRLDAHAGFIETMIHDRRDITLDEMVERLVVERDLHLGRSALSAWLRRRSWTFKKRPHTHWSRSDRTS
ncbi:transposase [Aureimonas pseudogalii]|uniref:Transposase n=1 Tax=Aureimonas pseudogalii TaxID=1744844 RepID=A0A7W6H980_9HYPH|nr:transposase [Aureimonas pseudogalii]